METTFNFQTILPYLAPVILLQLGLQVYCLVDLARRAQANGPKWLWAVIILLFQFFGAIIYLVVGRKE